MTLWNLSKDLEELILILLKIWQNLKDLSNTLKLALYSEKVLKNHSKYGGVSSGSRVKKIKVNDADKNKKCIVF